MKRIRRILRLFVLPLVVLWLLVWVILCQPIFPGGQKSTVSVAPEALKKHVRLISEGFFPRDYLNVKNLDRCSDYIRTEFEKAGAKVRVQEYAEKMNMQGATDLPVYSINAPTTVPGIVFPTI